MSELRRRSTTSAVLAALAILLAYAAAGGVGALIWHAVATLPRFVRTTTGASLDEVQLSRIVGVDGTYAVIALALSLLVTLLVTWRVRIDPIARVLLITAGAVVAAWVMLHLGLSLGPADPGPLVKDMKVGQSLPVQLRPHSPLAGFVWPVAALVASVVALLGGRADEAKATTPHGPTRV